LFIFPRVSNVYRRKKSEMQKTENGRLMKPLFEEMGCRQRKRLFGGAVGKKGEGGRGAVDRSYRRGNQGTRKKIKRKCFSPAGVSRAGPEHRLPKRIQGGESFGGGQRKRRRDWAWGERGASEP